MNIYIKVSEVIDRLLQDGKISSLDDFLVIEGSEIVSQLCDRPVEVADIAEMAYGVEDKDVEDLRNLLERKVTLIEEINKEPKGQKQLNREKIILDITEELCRIGDTIHGVVQSESQVKFLAKKLGVTNKKMKKILEGRIGGMTVKELADYATKLDCEIKLEFVNMR